MVAANNPRFEFTIEGLPTDSFQIVNFTGTEGLSQLYEFDILLASSNQEIDLDAVQNGRACLTVQRPAKQGLSWAGMVLKFDQLEQNHGLTFYRVVLVPRAWWLTQISTTQIFLDNEMHGLLDAILEQAHLQPTLDYEFRLVTTYPKRDWICQYDESHWNFFNRLMERGGLYFFFEQTAHGEKIVITDTAMSHVPLPGEANISYRTPSGLDAPEGLDTARSFRCALHRMPKEVHVRDYNYRNLKQVEGVHEVSKNGLGSVYRHVEDLRSNAEALYVAKARAEGMVCRERLFHGETSAPFLRPGYSFNLSNHYRSDFNRQYTTIELQHEAHQEAYIITQGQPARQDKPFYRNTFIAIPSDIQFRPEPKTPRPVVAGPVTAWIDGEGEGKYAEIDAMGRYKVKFPLDISGRGDGKASHWIRMLTPYGGVGHGMHMPLHKGTEVLVVFRDGNPDKPVISGAVPNMNQKLVVNESNNTQCCLTTAGDNKFHIEDKDGSQRFLLQTPVENSWVRIGAPNDPPSADTGSEWNWANASSKNGIAISTGNTYSVNCQIWNTFTLGESSSTVGGMKTAVVLGVGWNINLGPRWDIVVPRKWDYTPDKVGLTSTYTRLSDTTKWWGNLFSKKAAAENNDIGQQDNIFIEQNNQIAEVNNEIGEQQQDIGQQNNNIGEKVQNIGNNEQNVANQQQSIGNKEGQIGAQSANIGGLDQNIGEMNNNIGALNSNIGISNNNIEEENSIGESKNIVVANMNIL